MARIEAACIPELESESSWASRPVVAGPSNLLEEPKISLTNQCRVLSQVVTHQDHFATGGIHPYTAGLSHAANLPTTIAQALSQAGIGPDGRGIDAIAVAQGPGMASSLGVGLTAAKTLAATWNKHIIYIHHMADPPEFPYVTLLASGGHTMLVLARSPLNYELLATTSDDSIGDAFDKVARALGIQWGAATNFTNPGAALEHFAAEDTQESNGQDPIVFPVPSPGALSFS
ncbi:Mitochondrial tRNAs modification protein [Tilletia horrida]|nr:Mitochondrial tRNAs modification protein [Tilletia horrida]